MGKVGEDFFCSSRILEADDDDGDGDNDNVGNCVYFLVVFS